MTNDENKSEYLDQEEESALLTVVPMSFIRPSLDTRHSSLT
jgi:hypothetical protein